MARSQPSGGLFDAATDIAGVDDQPIVESVESSIVAGDASASSAVVDDGASLLLTPNRQGAVYTRDEIIDVAFAWFRSQGFPYRTIPKFIAMQAINRLAAMGDLALLNTAEAYAVADSFHPHRFHATVQGKNSPVECFNHDDKFRHALEMCYDNDRQIPAGYFSEITLSRNTQQCSNFRPGFACAFYRRFCRDGATVLDTSTGYGGRLVGFIASRINGRYIGVDPNTLTHASNVQLAASLGVSDRVELYNTAVEDLDVALVRDRCDFSFTSPPYFSKEHYSEEETQSWKRYGASFDAWVDGFLRPMIATTYEALRAGATAVINIEDVKIKGVKYPLVDAAIACGVARGFKYAGTESFRMSTRMGANQAEEVAAERVLLFIKPGAVEPRAAAAPVESQQLVESQPQAAAPTPPTSGQSSLW